MAKQKNNTHVESPFPSSHRGYLLNSIFKNSIEGIVVSDAQNIIIAVNQAFTEIMGYQAEEVVGKSGKFFRSGRHDDEFYKKLWEKIEREGHWEGEMWVRRKSGETFPEWLIFASIKNESGEVVYHLAIFSDITERKTTAERIQFLTRFDPLTRLPNRVSFQERLATEIKNKKPVGILVLKLNRFPDINHALGPEMGDAVLQEMALRLQRDVPQALIASRFSGSEFAMIFSDPGLPRAMVEYASKIIYSITHSFEVQNVNVSLTTNLGVSLYPDDGENPEFLIKNAEVAMQQSRQEPNSYLFFKSEMNQVVSERIKLENELKRAIENEELKLFYQPLVNLKSQQMVGVEALLRWQLNNEFISPLRFIPIAEQSGLIGSLTDWVLKTACQQQKQWVDEGLGKLIVAVNVTSIQFKQPDFVKKVLSVVDEMQMDPHFLKIEITEDLLLHDFEQVVTIMNELKKHGILFSIDDFGTGYSSLSYLLKLPVDQLKIDQSFTRGISTSPESEEIIKAIISVAKSLKLSVIAEGVESKEHINFLQSLGCDEGQGYFWSKPVPAVDIKNFLLK